MGLRKKRQTPESPDREKKTSFFQKLRISGWKNGIKEKIKKINEKSMKTMQSDEMLDLASKLKLHRSKVKLRTVIICAAVVILVLGAAIYRYVRVFHHYSIVTSVERSDDSATRYVQIKKGRTLKCNPNGITCVNDANEVQWNNTFTMQSPIVDKCGSTVVVGDQRGSEIYIFNEEGQVGHFSVEHILTKVKVAAQGVVAAVLEDGEVTWINVYDSQGNVLVRNRTSMAESGYPVDIDISSDGTKMAVSYLGIDNSNVASTVAFYNFSSSGSADSLVNSQEYEGHVVPEVEFLDGKYAVAFREDGFSVFSGGRVPEEKISVTVEQEIISAFSSDEYIAMVTLSDEEDQAHKYKMQLYRKNGSRSSAIYFDMEYTDICLIDDEIILNNNHEIVIYNVSGKKKFSGEYEKQVVEVMPASGLNRYTVITADSTDVIRLR